MLFEEVITNRSALKFGAATRELSQAMASGGTIDHKVMSVYKGGTLQRMPFTEALKNSSAVTAWNDHEERFTKHLEAIRAVNEEFQRLQGKEWTTFSKTSDLGKLYYEYILA